MSTGYVFGWLIAMILDNVLPMEVGDPMERARAAKKAKGVLVPLPSDAQSMLQNQQIADSKLGFESDSAHPEANIIPVSSKLGHIAGMLCCVDLLPFRPTSEVSKTWAVFVRVLLHNLVPFINGVVVCFISAYFVQYCS